MRSPEIRWKLLNDLRTPCYVYDPAGVRYAFRRLEVMLNAALVVSLKANPNVDLYERTADIFKHGLDLSSLRELELVHGQAAGRRYVNTPSLDEELCRAAIHSRASIVIDNPTQADILCRVRAGRIVAPVLLRLNAYDVAKRTAHSSAVRRDQFGMDLTEAIVVAKRLEGEAMIVDGVHTFAGSYSWPASAAALAEGMLVVTEVLEKALGHPLGAVNLGGGFPPDPGGESVSPAHTAALEALGRSRTILYEAGRAVFANAGIFVTRVMAVKMIDDEMFVICDGGIAHNFLLCQTEQLLKRKPAPSTNSTGVPLAAPATIVGPTCSRNDVIGKLSAGKPRPVAGDLIAFAGCGAYNATYSPLEFTGQRAVAVYILDSGIQT